MIGIGAAVLVFVFWVGGINMNTEAYDFGGGPAQAVVSFMGGVFGLGLAVICFIPEILSIVLFPVNGLIDILVQGSGSGPVADYWTADQLFAQENYRMALFEYKRIVLRFPKELNAYLKGIRSARSIKNEREEAWFRHRAMKKLTAKQDRNLFLGSLRRLDQ